MKILNLICKRTNFYLHESSCGWIMIDTDFPGTLYRFMNLLNQHDIKISDIIYLIVTHFHPDHAGIEQDLKNLGIRLILHECQVTFVDNLNIFCKKNPQFNFTDILSEGNIVISSKESRDFLKSMGIEGEIIQTPGHTDDSISLIIDGCCAFTGDLPEFSLMEAYNDQTIKDSWKLIKDYKITKIYPAHGNPYTII
ncbi:MAG: MBL fold metallo-hydrolase [Thermoanaerobacterium sp.]|nr:MBL fold metallo-hydrolase [Thermoanaerobacterium sp.]